MAGSNEVPCQCLRSVEAESLFAVSHSVHNLTPAVLPLHNMKLMDTDERTSVVARRNGGDSIDDSDPARLAMADVASGIFALSEIAFDKQHLHAIVSYSFSCGMLCGSGMTLVFEKVGDEWRRTNLECGGWVS